MLDHRLAPLCLAILVALAVPVAGGCSSYDRRYSYTPRPAAVDLRIGGAGGELAARALVSVVGLRRADAREGIEPAIEARFRVDNVGAESLTIDTDSLELITADLEPLPAPVVVPAGPVEVSPGGHATIDVVFPLPTGAAPRDLDLSALTIRWAVVTAGQRIAAQATVGRRPLVARSYYAPRYGYYRGWRCAHGYGWGRCRYCW